MISQACPEISQKFKKTGEINCDRVESSNKSYINYNVIEERYCINGETVPRSLQHRDNQRLLIQIEYGIIYLGV